MTNLASTTLTSSLIAGDIYDFSFHCDDRGLVGAGGDASAFSVSIGDQTLFSIANPVFDQNYTLIQGSFLSDGSSSIVKFSGAAPVDGAINITGVDVMSVAVTS